ncbi:MAG: response regulator [Chloroflexi bacterium]|nr:response regulator [Chloroflexota bacterium]
MSNATIPEAFVEQIKQALEHLYDFPYLQKHSLAGQFEAQPGETAGQRLRRELVDIIETFNPGDEFYFRSPHARLYNVLHLHYVEGMTIQETAHELGISVRQAYRDLRRGEQGVAEVIWQRSLSDNAGDEKPATELSSVQSEFARMEKNIATVDITELLDSAQRAVTRLAQSHDIQFKVDYPSNPLSLSTVNSIARQILVTILSHAVQNAAPSPVEISVQASNDGLSFVINYTPISGGTSLVDQKPFIVELCDHLGWKLHERHDPTHWISIHTRRHGPTILIIDDNEGLVNLLDRYLTGNAYQVVSAQSGWQGLQLANELLPDAIILDVMMPEMDGWELLQRLKSIEQTAKIPVIICSVFNDPELAYSLGASLFIAKPVSRDDILTALQNLEIV